MQVDRHIERLRALEDRPEPLVVEKDAVGEAVDHGALEAELGDVRSSSSAAAFGSLVGSAAKAAKRLRVGRDRCMQPIVDAAGERDSIGAGELLRRRRAVREDLHVDAGFVHLLEAQIAEIMQPLEHLGSRTASPRRMCAASSRSQ